MSAWRRIISAWGRAPSRHFSNPESKALEVDPAPGAIKALARAQVSSQVSSEGSARFLGLPDDISIFWWRTGLASQSLLVRDCYSRMFDKIQSHSVGKRLSGTVVLGNPGIGKTGFLWWSLWELLQQKAKIIIKLPEQEYICITDYVGGEPVVTVHKHLPGELQKRDHGAWYLADRSIPGSDWLLPCKFLLTCSPLKGNYYEFAKAGNVRLLFDPVWRLDELLNLNEHDFGHPPEDVEYRFSRWGGIPRYVLLKVDVASQMELDMQVGKVRDAATIISQQGLPEGVFHMAVDESTYSTYSLALASPYVEEKVYANLPMPSLKSIINTGQPREIRDIQGKLLEMFIVDKMIPQGIKLLYRELQQDGTFGPQQEEHLRGMKFRHYLESGGGTHDAVFPTLPLSSGDHMSLFKPKSSKNREWDFIAHGCIFQVTVSSERALKLDKGTEAALHFLRSFPGREKTKINFCILVPEFNLWNFAIDWFDSVKPEKGAKRRSQKDLAPIVEEMTRRLGHEGLNVGVRLCAVKLGDVCPTCMGTGVIEPPSELVKEVSMISAFPRPGKD